MTPCRRRGFGGRSSGWRGGTMRKAGTLLSVYLAYMLEHRAELFLWARAGGLQGWGAGPPPRGVRRLRPQGAPGAPGHGGLGGVGV